MAALRRQPPYTVAFLLKHAWWELIMFMVERSLSVLGDQALLSNVLKFQMLREVMKSLNVPLQKSNVNSKQGNESIIKQEVWWLYHFYCFMIIVLSSCQIFFITPCVYYLNKLTTHHLIPFYWNFYRVSLNIWGVISTCQQKRFFIFIFCFIYFIALRLVF